MNIGLISSIMFSRNIIMSEIRSILIFLDTITFTMVSMLFQAIFDIVNVDQWSVFKSVLDNIENKVYVIIGILMMFKVTVSLLTYLANPDKLNDKQTGGGKILLRIVTTLVLLIIVPTVGFDLLSKIQKPLVSTVGRIITGNSTVITSDGARKRGEDVSTTLMGTFFYPNSDCASTSSSNYTISSLSEYPSKAREACPDDKDTYLYTYVFGASNIVSGVACILLIIIGINVAIRAFKLVVLKVLAPIPILSYIDPKSAKDGMLSSYTKLFIKTYADLFVQYGVFYLVLELISKIISIANGQSAPDLIVDIVSDVSSGTISIFTLTGINLIFIVIGLLVFAVMAPKFIKKALNIKDSEFGTGLAGILSTGALIAGTAGATVNGVATSAAAGGGLLKNVGAGIAGAIGGLSAGAKAGFGSGKTDYSKIQSAITARNARVRADADAGVSFGTRLANLAGETFMGRSPFDSAKARVEGLDAFANYYQSMDDALGKEASKGKYGAVSFDDKVYGGRYSNIVGKSTEFAGVARAAEATGKTSFNYNGVNVDLAHASYIEAELKKSEKANLYDKIRNYDSLDPVADASLISAIDGIPDIKASIDNLEKEFNRSGASSVVGDFAAFGDNLKKLDDNVKVVKAESTKIKNSTEYVAASAAAKKK